MPTALSVSPVPKARACWPFLRPSWAFFRCSQRVQIIASQVVFSEYGAAFGGEIASLRTGREVGRRRVARQGSVRRFVATVLPFQSAKPPATLRHVCPGARSTASKVNPETNLLRPAEHFMSGQFPRGGPLDWSGRKFSSSIIRIGLDSVALRTRRYLPRRLFSPRPVSTIQPFSPSKFSRNSSASGAGDPSTDL